MYNVAIFIMTPRNHRVSPVSGILRPGTWHLELRKQQHIVVIGSLYQLISAFWLISYTSLCRKFKHKNQSVDQGPPVSCRDIPVWTKFVDRPTLSIPRALPHFLRFYFLHNTPSIDCISSILVPLSFLRWKWFVFAVLTEDFSFLSSQNHSRWHQAGFITPLCLYALGFIMSVFPPSSFLRALLHLFISPSLRRVFTVGVGSL